MIWHIIHIIIIVICFDFVMKILCCHQVVVTEGQPDKSVPITHAYNHHYIVSKL